MNFPFNFNELYIDLKFNLLLLDIDILLTNIFFLSGDEKNLGYIIANFLSYVICLPLFSKIYQFDFMPGVGFWNKFWYLVMVFGLFAAAVFTLLFILGIVPPFITYMCLMMSMITLLVKCIIIREQIKSAMRDSPIFKWIIFKICLYVALLITIILKGIGPAVDVIVIVVASVVVLNDLFVYWLVYRLKKQPDGAGHKDDTKVVTENPALKSSEKK